jgi:uncharacterized protein (DUF2141 family)
MSCPANLSSFSVTGDCQNNGSGGFTLFLSASAEPITITWIQPLTSPDTGQFTETINNGAKEYNNLSAGLYIMRINDSCGNPTATTQNNISTINIYVSSASSCVSLSKIIDTSCGIENGSLCASTLNSFGTVVFDLYRNDVLLQSVQSVINSYIFESLPDGAYYVIGNDGGGCTGKSETCIIQSSVEIDYGLYIVNDADCGNASTGVGRLFITGLTGVSPYTYQWQSVNPVLYLESTGQPLTGTSITGLTSGQYAITITDSQGCTLTKTATVSQNNPVTLGEVIPTPPTCFQPNGSIQITVIDGTPPYRYYIPSNSYIDVSYSQNYVFSGLTAGSYYIEVTDSALCNFNTIVTLTQPNSFGVSSVNITNTTCNNSNGSISVSLVGGTGTFTYTLISSNGNLQQRNGTTNTTFTNLLADNYTLTISDSICTFSGTYEVQATNLFNITSSVTGVTCGQSNGSVTITKSSGGTGPFVYSIEGGDGTEIAPSPPTFLSSYTFNNLSSGSYSITIEDTKGFCVQTENFTIDPSQQLDFVLIPTNSTNGSNGQIYANIYQGNPPYTLNWSSNVNGQTTTTVTNLSAGTYSLTVIDDDGCSLTRSITLTGNYIISNNSLFEVCDSTITSTGVLTERTISKMFNEGYLDVTNGCTGCLFSSATFSAFTSVAGTGFSQSFFTATTLTSVPTDAQWYNAVESLLNNVSGIGDVIIDVSNNTITINTSCEESTTGLANQTITVQLKIGYVINCLSC